MNAASPLDARIRTHQNRRASILFCPQPCTLGNRHWSCAECDEGFGEAAIFLGFRGRGLSRGKFGAQHV